MSSLPSRDGNRRARTGLAERLKAATEVLESVVARPQRCSARSRSRSARACSPRPATSTTPTSSQRRRCGKALRAARRRRRSSQRDESVLAETGIRVLREQAGLHDAERLPAGRASSRPRSRTTRSSARSIEPQHCYVCKQHYSTIHPFYDQLCPACGEFNFAQAHRDGRPARPRRAAHRRPREDRLPGGHQAAARGRAADRHDALPARLGGALRAGAGLRGVGRPPRDLRARPAAHAERRGVLPRTCCATRDRLDFIVNNACQTVRRPPDFYRHMLEPRRREHDAALERAARRVRGLRGSTSAAASLASATARRELSQVAAAARGRAGQSDLFPEGRSTRTCSRSTCATATRGGCCSHEVSSVELLETQLVNAVAPFVLNARLKPLMLRTPERDKHIVNVSAVEGQFYRRFKTTRHPHTNMAKAALNMMTRTSAADYHADGIHMNSVDTGWVTDEDPLAHRGAQDGRAPLPPAARHRRRRGAHRRPDHRRLQHRRARLGQVPEGLPADRLVSPRNLVRSLIPGRGVSTRPQPGCPYVATWFAI